MTTSSVEILIDRIYAAILAPDQWQAVIDGMAGHFGVEGAALQFVDPQSRAAPRMYVKGLNLADLKDYQTEISPHDPRVQYGVAQPTGAITYDYCHITETEIRRSWYYDWLRTHGFQYYIGTKLLETPQCVGIATLQRTPEQGHVQKPEIEAFAAVRRHLMQASQITDRLASLHWHNISLEHALGSAEVGVALLTDKGAPVFANNPFEAAIEERDGLGLGAEGIQALRRSEQTEIEKAVAALGGGTSRAANHATRIPRPSGKRPYVLRLAPFRGDEHPFLPRPSILAVLEDTEPSIDVGPGKAAEALRLTLREAEIAVLLARGLSPAEIAERLNRSLHTIRTHVKRICRKTDCHGRTELQALIAGLNTTP